MRAQAKRIAMITRRLFLFAFVTVMPTTAWAMDEIRLNALKVAYVYNFTKFIEWQERPAGGFRICLNTENQALIREFEKIEKKGPRVIVLNDDKDAPTQWNDCQIIYLETPLELPENSTRSFDNTLLVSEMKSEDAQIYFVLINNKLRFSIGKDRAEKAGLSISSKLLRLAHEIY
ncbi:MAG: YfiR family protein [Cellvibrionaceae bacterium]